MKIDERVLERRIQTLVDLDEIQFGFMPGRGTIDLCIVYFEYDARTISK